MNKRFFSLCLLVATLCVFPSLSAHGEALTDCASPEAAIGVFIDSIKSGDLNVIIDSFSIDNLLNGYDPNAEDAKYIPKMTNDERLLEAHKELMGFYVGFVLDWTADGPDLGDFDVESLINPDQYDTLEVVRIDLPEKDEPLHQSRISKENMYTRLYHAEGWDYRTALLKLNGNTYYCGFHFAKYNGKYEIIRLNCPMLSLSHLIVTLPCTEAEYEQLIGG